MPETERPSAQTVVTGKGTVEDGYDTAESGTAVLRMSRARGLDC
jgi:hypothetical protein